MRALTLISWKANRQRGSGMACAIARMPGTAIGLVTARPLTEGPKDAPTERNIPFRDRWHVRRSFPQPGKGKQKPVKPVSPKASGREVSGLRSQALTETPPDGFEPSTGCLEGSCSIQLS